MDILILRHAEAGEAASDEARELTEHGRDQARAVARGMAALGLQPDAVVCSPLPRARQTLEPVVETLNLSVAIEDALRSGQPAGRVLDLLDRHRTTRRVLLVGHEPQLSTLLLHLTGARVHMRKAMLAAVEAPTPDPGYGALSFLLSWKHLDRIGR